MRHFEYAGGGSEKFWEIGRDATSVTVRFGRIGTTGQTHVKDLGSEGAAGDHVARLVAEKLRKGYVENSTTVLPSPPAQRRSPREAKRSNLAQAGDAGVEPAEASPAEAGSAGAVPNEPDLDEGGWEVPAAWWRQAEPFRGRGPARSTAVDPAAPAVVAELRALSEPQLTSALGNFESDAELVQQARLFLGTPAGLLRRARHEVQPLGAAVVGAVLAATGDWRQAGGGVAREPMAAALADAVAVSAEIVHRGWRHLPPGWGGRAERTAQQLRGVGLERAAGALSDLASATRAQPGDEALGRWADTHLRLLVAVEQL